MKQTFRTLGLVALVLMAGAPSIGASSAATEGAELASTPNPIEPTRPFYAQSEDILKAAAEGRTLDEIQDMFGDPGATPALIEVGVDPANYATAVNYVYEFHNPGPNLDGLIFRARYDLDDSVGAELAGEEWKHGFELRGPRTLVGTLSPYTFGAFSKGSVEFVTFSSYWRNAGDQQFFFEEYRPCPGCDREHWPEVRMSSIGHNCKTSSGTCGTTDLESYWTLFSDLANAFGVPVPQTIWNLIKQPESSINIISSDPYDGKAGRGVHFKNHMRDVEQTFGAQLEMFVNPVAPSTHRFDATESMRARASTMSCYTFCSTTVRGDSNWHIPFWFNAWYQT